MEYLLCGIPIDCDYLIKYIKLSEDDCVHERVSEVIYYLNRYTIIISNTSSISNNRRSICNNSSSISNSDNSNSNSDNSNNSNGNSSISNNSNSNGNSSSNDNTYNGNSNTNGNNGISNSNTEYNGNNGISSVYNGNSNSSVYNSTNTSYTTNTTTNTSYTINTSYTTNTNSIFSIIYPADKNKSRKCLYRRRFSSNYICNNIEYIMTELGCNNKVVRIYDRMCYKYNNASIIIIKNKNKKIIIAKSDRPDGEVILEEIKEKLKLWVNLMTPPEDIHKYIP